MKHPILYRKRLIPEECIALKDDLILYDAEDILVTKWNTLKPRNDFHHGFSCYYFHDGFKISRFYREDGTFLYWYCDIVSFASDPAKNSIVVTDLLADVVILPDGTVKVLDLDELCEAKEHNLLSADDFFLSVRQLGSLLRMIENGAFSAYTAPFMKIISSYTT